MKRSDEVIDKILQRISHGESLCSICKDEDMPSQTSFFNWLDSDPTLVEKYARARNAQADYLVEETLEIADNASNDWMASNDPKNPGYQLNGENIQRSRLRVDARKWFASKVFPKKYGDFSRTELTGKDGEKLNLVGLIEASGIKP